MNYNPGEQVELYSSHSIKTIKERMYSQFHNMNVYRFTDGSSAIESEILGGHKTGLAAFSLNIRHRIFLATGKIIR